MSFLALLAGIVSAFLAASSPEINLVRLDNRNGPATSAQTGLDKPRVGRQHELRLQAEAAAGKAATLSARQMEKDLNAATVLFGKSASLFQAASLYDKAAEARLRAGEVYFTLSKYDKALASWREARNLDDRHPELLCLVLSRMAATYATTGQNSQASVYSTLALNKCRALSAPGLQAEGFEARGEALYNANETSQSEEYLGRARELFEQAGNKTGLAQAMLMSAYAGFHRDRAKSLQLAGEALKLWTALGDRHGVARTRNALGIFAVATDEFETGLCNYRLSLPVFRDIGDRDSEAAILNGMGLASRETGDAEASLEDYTRAKAIFTRLGDKIGTVESISGMGKVLGGLRRYQQLMSLYSTRLQLAIHAGNVSQTAAARADLGSIYELRHDYAQAQKLYSKSLKAYTSANQSYGIGDVLIRMALLRTKQGETSQAIALLEKALPFKNNAAQPGEIARINYELAALHRRLNHIPQARAAIEKTVEIIESQRLKITNFDSRASYFSSVHEYYALYIKILMLLHRNNPEQGFDRLALQASEKSKVRALLDLLNVSRQGSPCDELLQRQLAPPDSAETRAADLSSAGGGPSAAPPPVLSAAQVQTEIGGDHTVLLEYELGDERSYVWFVDSGHVTPYELPPAEKIRKLVRSFRSALTAREPRPGDSLEQYKRRISSADNEYPVLARQLSQQLLDPLKQSLADAKRVLIVPDGALQHIPFAALPLGEAGEKNAVLMTHREVVILPSASALSALRKMVRARPTRTAVIVADPVVEKSDDRVLLTRKPLRKKPLARAPALSVALRDAQSPRHLARLNGSRVEAETIREALGAPDVLLELDFDASRSNILSGTLEPYRIVHFATHGIIDARHPEMSGLVLSLVDEKGQPQNGYLRLGDIYNLKLSADLVVLSACNSALGKDLESEGIIGLPRGFLYAGGKSVIASLWKVDDEAGASFMKGFYARIRQGESPSSALRGAQLDMAEGGHWPEPFYWAAFVLQGDYK